jgi:hypothetical protein
LAKDSQRSVQDSNEKYEMVTLLHDLGANLEDKEHTLLFVPQDNYFYWNMMQFRRIQYVAGSLSKMAMLQGIQPFIPLEINKDELAIVSQKFTEQDRDAMYGLLKKNTETGNYLLNTELQKEDKIRLYNILSPYYADQLINYSYGSYNTHISEEEYLEITKDDDSLCHQAKIKGFNKVIILTDQDHKPKLRELDCDRL